MNENNYSFVYSNSDQNWEIKSSDNLIIYKKTDDIQRWYLQDNYKKYIWNKWV